MAIQQQRTSGINGVPFQSTAPIEIGVKWINKPDFHNEYCGRGSVFGNPYPITPAHSRDAVCDAYEEYFKKWANTNNHPIRIRMVELLKMHVSGKPINLQCYCAPKRCHCETIRNALLGAASRCVKTK